jgi:hypothetical protein
MNRQSVVSVVMMAAVVAVWGCAGTDAPPGPAGPTLSLLGASGITAEVRRTVTEISGGTETVVSVADTTIWAPFDKRGAAMPSSDEAGVPGPIGWLVYDGGLPPEWSRYASFVDSTGMLHELWLSGKGQAILERMQYRRGGALALEYHGEWLNMTGGWLLDTEAMTFHPGEGLPFRIDVATQQADVARALPGADALFRAAALFTGLLRPQPLEAQMYFQECSGDWLKWIGTALLTELAWGKFIKSKRPSDFKKALAATTAAGVALSALVDCMDSQPVEPEPSN